MLVAAPICFLENLTVDTAVAENTPSEELAVFGGISLLRYDKEQDAVLNDIVELFVECERVRVRQVLEGALTGARTLRKLRA